MLRRISSVNQMPRMPAESGLVPPSSHSSESSSDREQPTTIRRILSLGQQDAAKRMNRQNARWPSSENSAVSKSRCAIGKMDCTRQISHRRHNHNRSRFGSLSTFKTADELERQLKDLSARTKAAIEATYAEIDVLKKERSENAKTVEELQDELRKLRELREERRRKKAELAATAAVAEKKRMSRCSSAPDLDFLRLKMAGAAAVKKGSADNFSLNKSGKVAAPAPVLMRRSQSSSAGAATAGMRHFQSCGVSTNHRVGYNNRNASWPEPVSRSRCRRSLTERLSESIGQLRRNNNNARAITELSQRLIELHRCKSSAVSELSQRMQSKDEDLSKARRAVDFLREEKEKLKKERDALRAMGDEENQKRRNEREQLMTMAVELMESVRGKDRQLRYMATSIGQKMAVTEDVREANGQ